MPTAIMKPVPENTALTTVRELMKNKTANAPARYHTTLTPVLLTASAIPATVNTDSMDAIKTIY